MNAASLPSGEITVWRVDGGRSAPVHCVPRTSQVQRFRSVSNENDCVSALNVIC